MAQRDPCSVCGATLREEQITYTDTVRGTNYAVEGVGALLCSECGVEHLSPETVLAVHELIERHQVTA